MIQNESKSLGEIVQRTKNVLESVNKALSAGEDNSEDKLPDLSALCGINSKSLAGIQQISMTSDELKNLTENLENLINSLSVNSKNRNKSGNFKESTSKKYN